MSLSIPAVPPCSLSRSELNRGAEFPRHRNWQQVQESEKLEKPSFSLSLSSRSTPWPNLHHKVTLATALKAISAPPLQL